jgi:xanthine dehydrogenase YagS FAD-binding subunit
MTDLMKLDVIRPDTLVDINRMGGSAYAQIEESQSGLRFGALVRMADAQDHPLVTRNFPVIAESLRLAASQQIRTMASLGGNVLQRTRCAYFRETSWPCNKRTPGSGCAAIDGVNRHHAVLGTSDHCIAAYPGDFAQALIALDASIETVGPNGPRRISFATLHRPPEATPDIETVLHPGELITFIDIPAKPWARRSHYLKIRDRESYAFALASAAIVLDMEGDIVRQVRIALGGVATVPWRAGAAENLLKGQRLDDDSALAAAEAAFADARGSGANNFKISLGKRTLVRALFETKHMQV